MSPRVRLPSLCRHGEEKLKARGTVRVQVYIDGAKAWNVTVMGRPVKKRTGGTVGGLLPSLLEMLGFKRRRWA